MERRSHHRQTLQGDVTVIHNDGAGVCLAADISLNGIGLRADRSSTGVPVDGPVLVYFNLPEDDRPHFALGQTERSADGAAGIRFTVIPTATRDGVAEFLRSA